MKQKQFLICLFILLVLVVGGLWLFKSEVRENKTSEQTKPQLKSQSTVVQKAQSNTAPLPKPAVEQVAEQASEQKSALNQSVKPHANKGDFRMTTLEVTPARTRFRLDLDDYEIVEEEVNGKTYSVVKLSGAWDYEKKGKPALPVKRLDFAVAKGRHAALHVLAQTEETVVCAPPLPSAGTVMRHAPAEPLEEEAAIYGGQGAYPAEAVAAGGYYIIRGVEGREVSFSPMRYDFGNGTMLVTRSLEAEIVVDGALENDYAMRDDEWNFRQLLRRRFANGALLRSGEQSMQGIGKLLLITPDGWEESLSDYIAWRERLGYTVITAGYPSMTGEDIGEYIEKAYHETAVSHVVLCGDIEDLPPAEVSIKPNAPNVYSPTTDAPYSWVDGDDEYADLFLSRMSVSSVEELQIVCAKIIFYEQAWSMGSWRSEGLFIGSNEKGSVGVSSLMTDSEFLEVERQKMLAANVIDNGKTLFQTEQNVTALDITNYLNVGCSFVYYLGHGYSNRWTTGSFQNTNAASLHNCYRIPFVASFCCSTANFAYKQPCLGEAFLRNEKSGAVGFLGATSETYWNPPIYAMRQLTDDILNRHAETRLTCLGAYAFSSIIAGIDYLNTTSDKYQGTNEYFAKQMIFLGDCSAMGRLGSGRKAVFTIGRASAEEYAVTVRWEDTGEPVNGAAVCIQSQDGQSRHAARSGEDGVAMVRAFEGKSIVTVSDSGWGYQERPVDAVAAMDTDADGFISNLEAIHYLNYLGNSLEENELKDVAKAWSRGGVLSMRSRMSATTMETDSAGGGVRSSRIVNDVDVREPGGDMEPVSRTRTETPVSYWSVQDLNKRIQELCMTYPAYCREHFVGRSVEGRDIMGLRISCLGSEEVCPEYLIAAGIHGNERLSTWMAMRLVEAVMEDLSRNEKDSVYRPLLSRCALWIVPSMNPDGASFSRVRRENANGHDLNRSFPDGALQTMGSFAAGDRMLTNGYLPLAEYDPLSERFAATEVPETTAIMRFCMEHAFKAALHLHSGSFLVSYPYGNNAERQPIYTAAEDDSLFITLAQAYCNAYDGYMSYINSSEWYPVDGEAPDWQYRYTGTLPLTVELYGNKEPMYLESCESIWTCHEKSFAAWLTTCLDIADGAELATDGDDGIKVSAGFKRLMPNEKGRIEVKMEIGHEAMVLNMACESGLELAGTDDETPWVVGSRTEDDGSTSWLLYRFETTDDASFWLDVRMTDDNECNDHIVSFAMLSEGGERLVFRRQLLLAERRSFSCQLNKGWNFISSPLKGAELTVGEPCQMMAWNGMRYTDTTDLQAADFIPGKAFWVYSQSQQLMSLDGRMGLREPTLRKGWNAVGGLYSRVSDESVYTVEGNNGYYTKFILPGMGYWIFVK